MLLQDATDGRAAEAEGALLLQAGCVSISDISVTKGAIPRDGRRSRPTALRWPSVRLPDGRVVDGRTQ